MRYTATFAFASSGKKIPVHLLFRELTGPEFERTQSQFQNDLIKWTLDAWENIDCGMLEKVARKCYMSPYDLDDDMEIYGPLHADVDINA